MDQITLYLIAGKSDKVYHAAIEPRGDGYVVTFAYGRRGGTLTTGSKTTSPVSLEDARAIYDKLVGEKKAKGYAERTLWRLEVEVVRCSFFIEPQLSPGELNETSLTDQEDAQGFASYPRHAQLCCDDVWTMTLDYEVTSTVPPLEDAEMAVCMPIEVVDDNALFYRNCDDDNTSGEHLDIPRGRYDMLVRIYPTEGTGNDGDGDEDEGDDDFEPHCKASLTFLPRGTIGPKCFRRGYGRPVPSRVVIHTAEGRAEESPN